MCRKGKPLARTGKRSLSSRSPRRGPRRGAGPTPKSFRSRLEEVRLRKPHSAPLLGSLRNGIFRHHLEELIKMLTPLECTRKGMGGCTSERGHDWSLSESHVLHLAMSMQQHGTSVCTDAWITLAGHPGWPTLELMRHENTQGPAVLSARHSNGLWSWGWPADSFPLMHKIQQREPCPPSTSAAALTGLKVSSCELTYHPILPATASQAKKPW